MKSFVLVLIICINIGYNVMTNYQILDWNTANEIKQLPSTHFLEQMEYNLASVYQLEDSSYLLMPLNPFAKCLLAKDKATLDSWIAESYFPTDEDANNFYLENKEQLENIYQCKEQLKEALLKYVYKGEEIPKQLSGSDIDAIYKLLKKRKRFKEYQLHFILLAGEYLIEQNPNLNCRWGVLSTKQLLNPVIKIVLVTNIDNVEEYFKMEDRIVGKWGYQGIMSMDQDIKQFWKRPDGVMEILKKL